MISYALVLFAVWTMLPCNFSPYRKASRGRLKADLEPPKVKSKGCRLLGARELLLNKVIFFIYWLFS